MTNPSSEINQDDYPLSKTPVSCVSLSGNQLRMTRPRPDLARLVPRWHGTLTSDARFCVSPIDLLGYLAIKMKTLQSTTSENASTQLSIHPIDRFFIVTSNPMAPIRIGIIGLSSNGGWASSAWAPYLQQTDHYKIIAVCNSSIQSSKTAIDSFGLEHARPYDSPADLAQDDQVELVICCVSVFHHYEVLQPALESGKDVYVEWPLAENLEIAGKLVKLAKNGGGRTQVGLQGRFSDAVSTIARFLDKGDEVGKVLSTSFSGSSANPGTGRDMQRRYRYFLDGNKDDPEIMPLIYLGHGKLPFESLRFTSSC